MIISGQGWELLVSRQGAQQSGRSKRTYGTYQVYVEDKVETRLSGHMCECIGPGDNLHAGNKKRIEQGRYPLWTQVGRYQSVGYSQNSTIAASLPMPGLRLEGTGKRTGILIHPGHPPKLYLSSIGCLNPTAPLKAEQSMNFWDSRARVIALIDSLREFAPAAFQRETVQPIANAWVVVDGEPMNPIAGP